MNKELSDKYIAQMKNCTWEGDHEDADILICQFLEEIGYQDEMYVDIYQKIINNKISSDKFNFEA